MKKYKIFYQIAITLSIFLLLMVHPGWAAVKTDTVDEAAKNKVVQTYMKLPLHFIKNEGQVDGKVKFYEKGSGHSTFFTEEGIYMTLHDNKEVSNVKLSLLNANKNPKIIGEDRLEGKVNYFIGNDKKKWKTDISTYSAVKYKDIYENIDIKFYGNNRQLEYDIVVEPGTDPSLVKFSYEGIEGLKVTDEGNLEVDIKGTKIIHKKPFIYQVIDGKRVEIEGAFNVYDKHTFGFKVASYNKNQLLIIDPVLVYSTYLGGSNEEYGRAITVDSLGNAYVTGNTNSIDFPTQDSLQAINAGDYDAFVTKIDATGNTLVYSTYLGGNSKEVSFGIGVDGSGCAYVAGYTGSSNFPTQNPFQSNNAGDDDVFVTKINAAGNALVYSTYLGGSNADYGRDIAVDSSGNAYVTGYTGSADFPTLNPIQPNTSDYPIDAFVTKINAAGNAFLYSTYLGGSDYERGYAIAVDSSGSAYVTGYTASTDFPTQNPFQSNNAGNYDAFLTKIGGFPEDPTPNPEPPPAPEPPPGPEPDPEPIAEPTPEIKANSLDGPVTLTTSDTLSITVSFTSGDSLGVNADWWVVADTPFGWYYYLYPHGWYYAGDLAMLLPTYQGGLGDVGTFEILNITGLPPGTYVFFFAVDTAMNGQIDFDQLYYDGVVVNVTQ